MNRKRQIILTAQSKMIDFKTDMKVMKIKVSPASFQIGFIAGANWADSNQVESKEWPISCKGECRGGIEQHPCPYKSDINNDNTLCSCCDSCTRQCSDNR